VGKNFSFKDALIVLTAAGALLFSYDGFAENGKGKEKPAAAAAEKGGKIPDMVATVNGVKISGAEFSKSLQSYKRRFSMMGQQFPEDHAKDINKSIIEDMVSRELLIQNSNKIGIKVSDDELNKEIKAIKSKFPSADQFNQMIKSQNMTMEDVKADIRKAIHINRLVKSEIEGKISIEEKTINEYYKNNSSQFLEEESVKASHILVKADKNASKDAREAAKKKIDGLLKRVKKGEDFAKLAKENSDDPGSGQNGGDLGFFSKGMMVPPFEKAAFGLKKDEISDVVETEFGYHIIKLTDRKPSRTIPLNEVQDKLKSFLKSMEVNKKLTEYIANLRKTADVKIVEF
jgi:peptidyl-prolyl cis-trans isomerase C